MVRKDVALVWEEWVCCGDVLAHLPADAVASHVDDTFVRFGV